MLQIFAERDGVAVGLLHAAVAAEDFQGGSEAGEDGVRADDAFLGETRHPFVNSAGQCGENVAPIADFVRSHRAVGILARAADEMDGGGERGRIIAREVRLGHFRVDRP